MTSGPRIKRRKQGASVSDAAASASAAATMFFGAAVCACIMSMKSCRAFQHTTGRVQSGPSRSFHQIPTSESSLVRLYESSSVEHRDAKLPEDAESGEATRSFSSPHEFERRNFLLATAAAVTFFPLQSADAKEGSQSLESLQFARGSWNPGRQATRDPVTVDDDNLLASAGDANAVQNSVVPIVPACFTTYLTRFLINYDEGVAAWWQQLLVSYSLLPEDQRQNRLGRDFGSLAVSIQEAVETYLNKAKTHRQGYEQLFERFASTYVDATTDDEVKRQLCLLAATLPVDQQPSGIVQKILPASATPTATATATQQSDLATLADLSALLPRDYTPILSNSDELVSIQPPISLYQVGVGEEFGQAATATTFGPLALTGLRRELPHYTFDVYALFGISGATGCALTHSVVIPLDVVKTRAQTSTEPTMSIVTEIVEKEGIGGLLTGAQATLAGYAWYGISVYPSYAFFKRFLALSVLTPDLAVAHTNDIALIAGALAAVIASLGLTPLEAARIRVVSEPARYRDLGLIGTMKAIGSEGNAAGTSALESLYKGLPSLMTRQVIFGSVKFLAFERACEFIYMTWPVLRDATWTALTVSLVAGAFSGALSCFVSQPADAVLTYVAQENTGDTGGNNKGLGVLEGSRLMIEECGVSSLYRGLGSRSLWAASIISGQFLLYDIFRNYFGINSEDLSQVFQIDL
eukprot:CAMPEP_0172367666 /NCGR_PEP_ID=MMETSP1060-20121228/22954_1 /TAXON_ID=37318 /ORGANISM="Pseudo-nitzschia pungens, Strain cf. cingulata" /LENGTH=695 /DNA_ID=CAMNT_0013091999 /DNA_START=368 /DNA_END=2455 /DNA_ORIENTATION=-